MAQAKWRAETLNDYPEMPEFDIELRELSKIVLRANIGSRQELFVHLAQHYAKRSGLTVHPPVSGETTQRLRARCLQVIEDILVLYESCQREGLQRAQDEYMLVAHLSQQVPEVMASHGLSDEEQGMLRRLYQARVHGQGELSGPLARDEVVLAAVGRLRDLPAGVMVAKH
eukprot:TRINITY_DN8749_c0_g1_i1.p2 TRINITY_DN8749_c0_g1~~TRINITY_DN8749_c0_g1_i1.p2  ORF type:complete len:171 (+),score=63.44 TRINITY_DN8749_c0_g1_i1:84-596(+)